MDPGVKGRRVMATFLQWEKDHGEEAKEAGFEFVESTDTSLKFRARGMLFQLIIPEAFLQNCFVTEETFIAMSLDNSAPESLLMTINEKLERLQVGDDALERVLGAISKTVVNFRGRGGGSPGMRIELQSDTAVLSDGMSKDVVPSSPGGQECDEESDEWSTEENLKPNDSDDEYFFTCNGSDDHREIYVTDDCGERGMLSYLERIFKDGAGAGQGEGLQPNGYLDRVIREAKQQCEAARGRSISSFSSGPASRSFSGLAAASYMDDILQFCNLSLARNLSWVQVRVEACGIVNDARVAAALGFSLGETLQIFLDFGAELWSEFDLRKGLEVHRVTAKLESATSGKAFPKSQGSDCETSGHVSRNEAEDERERLLEKQDALAYGVKVLLPELARAFFRYRSEQSTELLRSKPWENTFLDEALQYFAAVENPLVGFVCFLGTQLRALPSWCAVCWSQLPVSVERLRTCQDDLCLYEFEELGLGASIHQEIKESPEVVQFELSLACAAASASHRDVFEPFPAFCLSGEEMRGRSGWFTVEKARISSGPLKIPAGPPTVKQDRANKNMSLLLDTLQSLPKLKDLKECADENSLKRKLSKMAFSRWKGIQCRSKFECKEMSLSYDLMRFILSTNRLSLGLLTETDKLEVGIDLTYQFVVLHDSPEKEASFEERRIQRGSFFAFHGSGRENWYSIMRNGLRSMSKTQYMTTGNAYGDGLYLANNYSLAYSYANRGDPGQSWRPGDLSSDMTVVAVCEVLAGSANVPASPKALTLLAHLSRGMYVVPPCNQDDVALRYLLVLNDPKTRKDSIRNATIEGTVLRDAKASKSVNLREHCESLRLAARLRQQRILEEQRMKAFLRVNGDLDGHRTGKVRVPIGSTPTGTDIVGPESSNVKEKGASNECLPLPTSASAATSKGCGILESSKEREIDGSKACRSTGEHERPPTSKRLKETTSGNISAVMTAPVTQAIMKEYRNVQKEICKAKERKSVGGQFPDSFLTNITVDIPDEANLHIWHVGLHQNLFKSYPNLYNDLQNLATSRKEPECSVHLEVTFSDTYPSHLRSSESCAQDSCFTQDTSLLVEASAWSY